MQLTGAEIIVECLKEQGVDTVFGYPGGAILNVYDALYEYKDQITHVLTSHEQGASHAADGYARATGKVGVCLATSGPGATNLVTGIATAYMDSVPMVAITCNVGTPLLGKDSFQEVDITGIVMPITKHSFIVKDITTLADTVRRAFYIAKSGRPGPVLVDVTKDVTGAKYEYTACAPAEITPKTDTIKDEDIATAVQMIKEAKRPFIFTGGGTIISEASREVTELAHRIDAPVCDSLMGKGGFSGEDPLYTGMRHPEWTAHISELKEKYPLRYDHSQLTGPYIIEKLYELTKGDAIITTEVGQNQMWAAQYFKYKEPRTFLSSGGLGTMGYGLGAAIGAKMGRPDKTVVNIAGDGCFRMNMNEIATAVRCGRPLIEIVLNNHVLGMVRQWQTLFYDHRYSHTILNDAVDFVKLAEAMGAKAIRITKMEEVEPALKEALACPGPIVLDCMIDQDLSVFPMVPAGASIDDIFDEEDMKNNEQSV